MDVLLPLEADDGDYEVSYWFIVDNALNDNYLTGNEIAELGFSNKISFNGTEANNKPIITSSSFTIDENQTNIGTIQVFDGDDDVLTYALSGGDSESISIDSTSGILSFNNAPDYETKSSYSVIVEVSDDVHAVQKAIAIEINNLNDNTPVISSSASFSINEGETNVGQVSATDADGDSISYSISGSDASALTIDSSSGVLTFNSAPDFNTKSSYSITATASDGENAADQGVGITEEISNDLFNSGVDVITTGNHVWDQKETANHIEREKRLLRPENISSNSPGKGFGIYESRNGFKVGVLNLMGNVFMKKCEDVFVEAKKTVGSAIIIVEDNGPGIPESELLNVFKPFYRIDKSRGQNKSGVGLGLSIASDIVRSHGGNIKLEKSKIIFKNNSGIITFVFIWLSNYKLQLGSWSKDLQNHRLDNFNFWYHSLFSWQV